MTVWCDSDDDGGGGWPRLPGKTMASILERGEPHKPPHLMHTPPHDRNGDKEEGGGGASSNSARAGDDTCKFYVNLSMNSRR